MTNFHDPKVMLADGLAFVKLLYLAGGVYIWEFSTTLWFEWQIVTRRRPYRWSIWLYSGCRLSALFSIITIFVGFNFTTPMNCTAWLVMVLFFAHSACVFASALIVLRIYAIWERQIFPCTIAITAWLVNVGFYIHSMIRSEATWDAEQFTCVIIMTKRDMLTPLVTLGENIVLLALMLIGLRRYRVVGMHGLWGYVHRQGMLWLVLVIIAEFPTTVLIILNLNGYLNLMFYTPELIVMTIGASRIYRGLAEYSHTARLNQLGVDASFHGVAPSIPSTMGMQLNSLPETYSYSNSLSRSHSRTRLQLSQETPRLRSYSQTGLHPRAIHSPPPLPPPQYPPPPPPTSSPLPTPAPPPPSPEQTQPYTDSVSHSHPYARLQHYPSHHRLRSYSQTDLQTPAVQSVLSPHQTRLRANPFSRTHSRTRHQHNQELPRQCSYSQTDPQPMADHSSSPSPSLPPLRPHPVHSRSFF